MPSWADRLLGEPNPKPRVEGSGWVDALLLVGPPLTVVATLATVGTVTAAFLVYHVAWCLLVPAAISLLSGRSLAEHRELVGLRHARDRRALGVGALVGLAMCLGILLPFVPLADVLLADADLAGQLAVWGVPEGAKTALFVYMIVFNSGAEELYWRGYVHERLAVWRNRWATILLVSAVFASYHYYTIWSLIGDPLLAAGGLVGVFLGAVTWAILRERYDSCYPAILAHVGATAGYMGVYVLWV